LASLIDQLIDILEEQAAHYDNLLGLSQEKRDAIIANDVELLNKITGLENILVGQNQKLEKQRLSVTADIATVMNMDPETINLSSLLAKLRGQASYPRLAAVAERIRAVIPALKEANSQNRILIGNSMEFIDYSMNVIQAALGQGPDVFAGGRDTEITRPSMFDRKQ